ncbi:hypothetical protein ACJMK2_022187 [Sinanodonta woodiana]|uniref:Uncharacterized protein n=1 Tax=Sinanodonta woodiana TaxID=1069815 RepID=A0ABD3TK58_SINWO
MSEPDIVSCVKDEHDSSDSDNGNDVDTPVEYRLPGVEDIYSKTQIASCFCTKCVPVTNQEENICSNLSQS